MVDMWVYLEMPCLAISDLQTSVPNLFTLCSGLVLFRSPGITYILLHRSELLKLCLISSSCLVLCFNVEHVLHSIMNALLKRLKPKSCISNLATKHLFPSRACLLALSLSLSLSLSISRARSLARSLFPSLSLTLSASVTLSFSCSSDRSRTPNRWSVAYLSSGGFGYRPAQQRCHRTSGCPSIGCEHRRAREGAHEGMASTA